MNCKIIQDLLPLYRDEVCSQESRQAVDEHIQSCPHCAEVLREMGREENLDRETADVDREKAQVIAGVKRRFSAGNACLYWPQRLPCWPCSWCSPPPPM